MTPLEALERFCGHIPRDISELTVRAESSDCDLWPEAMTAAVSLSGMLDDATSDDDLIAGVQHFTALHEAGVFSDEQWVRETNEVIAAVSAVAVPLDRADQHARN